MVKPPFRTKSVGTKVSDAEYAGLEERARASGLTLSEWVRDVLLATGRRGSEGADGPVLLGELLALRTIVINLLFSVSKGEPVTAEGMKELIGRADGDKVRRALERLEAARLEAAPEGHPENRGKTDQGAAATEDAVKES
jgi:hypothetical protein